MFKRLFASRKNPYIPGLDNPEHISLNIGGCRLEVDIPPHYNSDGFGAKKEPTNIPYIYDSDFCDSEGFLFNGLLALRRNFEYLGPVWHTTYLGFTEFSISVERVNCLPEGMSCLNPAHLEQVILRFLYEDGPESPQFGKKIAPVNWQVKLIDNQPWVLFEQRPWIRDDDPDRGICLSQFHAYAATALDDRYFLLFDFNNFGYTPSDISIANMNAFKNHVIGSIRWQLSDAAQQRLKEVKVQWPDAEISTHREPEDWIYPEWHKGDRNKGEPYIVIEKYNTQPPEFKF